LLSTPNGTITASPLNPEAIPRRSKVTSIKLTDGFIAISFVGEVYESKVGLDICSQSKTTI
jgi:hypothetical protein